MKKFYSFVLMAVALLVGTNAWAENVAKNVTTGTEYETLQKAVKEASAGNEIQLIANINCAQGVYVDKSLTIDLAGFTYQSEGALDTEANQDVACRNFKIVGSGTVVTVKNGTMIAYAEVNADVYPTAGGASTGKGILTTNGAYGTVRTEAGSTVNLENLELYNYHPWGLNMKICSSNNNSLEDLQITPSTANIKNCKVYSNIGGGIEVAGGVANIESTEFIQTGKNLAYGYIACNVAVSTLGRLTVNTTSFKSTGDHSIYVYSSGGLIQVKSGVFAGETDVINITKADAATVATNMYSGTNKYSKLSAENKAKARTQAQNLITQFVTELGGTDTDNASQIIVVDGDFDGKIKVTDGTKLGIEGGTFANTGLTQEQFAGYLVSGVEVVTNPDGTQTVAKSGENKTDFSAATEESVVTVADNQEITGVVTVKQLNINDASSVTVKDGGELHINGQMGAIIADGGKLNIETGGKVFVESGLIHNNSVASINIETKEGKPAIMLIAPNTQMYGEDNPNATVKFISKSFTDGAAYAKQRFGIPTIGALTAITAEYNNNEIQTAFDRFDGNNWVNVGYIHTPGKTMDYSQMANPFEYYQMQNNNPEMGTVVTMTGSLVGNTNPKLNVLGQHWNGYANSFMGRMSIEQLINMIPNTVDKTIYLYDITQNQATWEPLSLLNAAGMFIDPMQPFLIRNTMAAADVDVDYAAAVYTPAITPASAPARRVASDMTRAKLVVRGEGCIDRVLVAESNDFTADFDNGYDAAKYMNDGINMYVSAAEKMSIYATDDLDNTYVGVAGVKGGTYSLSFENVEGDNLTLIDLATGAQVAMTEGNTYEFTVAANESNDYRFQIVGRAAVATDVETVEAAKVSGVYTLMGQYVGQMSDWNNLPAGVYVVDGVKRVK